MGKRLTDKHLAAWRAVLGEPPLATRSAAPAPEFPEDPEDCEHGRWNPDNRQCLDCGHITPEDLASSDTRPKAEGSLRDPQDWTAEEFTAVFGAPDSEDGETR